MTESSRSAAYRPTPKSQHEGILTVSTYDLFDDYDEYSVRFDSQRADRRSRRARRPRRQPRPRLAQATVIEEVADAAGLEGGFSPSYQPSKYEEGWLLQSLGSLYDQQFITDVLALIRGGKEASVYCCAAHESTGVELLAAKVYRPRKFRQLRNDKMYRQGREVIAADGTRLNNNDFREMRAISKGSAYGKKLQHTSWLMYEYKTLERLYAAGAAVPRPWAIGDNVVLMDYIGGEGVAAPTLNTVHLERDEASALFRTVLHNIELMLQQQIVHGDLSAYNILYWDGAITLIDFPQVTDLYANPDAAFILRRDVTRLSEYFAAQGVVVDADALADDLWYRYGPGPDAEI